MNVFFLSWAAAGLALLGLSLFPRRLLAPGRSARSSGRLSALPALARPGAAAAPPGGGPGPSPGCWTPCCPLGWPSSSGPAAGLPVRRLPDVPLPMGRGLPGWGRLRGREALIGNYNAPYLYFLAAISYLPIPDLYLIKLFSILFDVVLAWGGFRLVRHFAPERPNRPLLCFCLLLLLPTVILNGAFWGQCDALYGALTLHALACALERRNRSSLCSCWDRLLL